MLINKFLANQMRNIKFKLLHYIHPFLGGGMPKNKIDIG